MKTQYNKPKTSPSLKQVLNLFAFSLPIFATCQTDDIGQFVNCSDPFDVSIELNQPKCYGDLVGSLAIDIQGGNPFDQGDNFENSPYLIDWDKNVYDGMTTIEYLPNGVYNISITDQAGCNFTLEISVETPEEIMINSDVTNAVNNQNGAIDLEVSGGTGNYAYVWQNGSHSEDLSGLESGSYAITVYDENNCSANDVITVGNSRVINKISNSFAFQHAEASRTANDDIKISPNPASEQIMIEWEESDVKLIVISDEYGRIVDQVMVTGQNIVSIQTLRPGIHRLAFINENNNIITNKNVIIQ